MPANKVPSKIIELVTEAQKQGYPQALQMRVDTSRGCLFEFSFGKNFKYFDISSVTKIMTTTALVMLLFDQKKISLDAKVSSYLPYAKNVAVGDIIIRNLLAHVSGL